MEFNGRSVSAKGLGDALEQALVKQVKAQIEEQVRAIRDPETGAFATAIVRGDRLDDMTIHVEGGPKLLEIVREKLGIDVAGPETVEPRGRLAFLSYTHEDAATAKQIAEQLVASGIDVWWDRWCMNSGDSLRQKIEEGLDNCTHFIVLLSPNSIEKPWVKQEIDAALVNKLANKCKFVPLRMGLPVDRMSAFLRSMVSPSVDGDGTIQQLINEIYEVTKKPPLGLPHAPISDEAAQKSGYSPAAMAVAKAFVTDSETGCFGDLDFTIQSLAGRAGLTLDDTADALHELRSFVKVHKFMGDTSEFPVIAEDVLFANFDQHWRDWNPSVDALRLGADILNDEKFPGECQKICDMYGWEPRRLNPAVSYLAERDCLWDRKALGTAPFVTYGVIGKVDELRRFLRGRS